MAYLRRMRNSLEDAWVESTLQGIDYKLEMHVLRSMVK